MNFRIWKYFFLFFPFFTIQIIAQYNFEVAFPNLTFSSAINLQNANDGTDRIFVVEQAGKIKVFQNQKDVTAAKIFLDITDRVTSGGETGLLGLAFHPNYKNNGYFYVNYTAPNPLHTVISRFTISNTNPDSTDKNSEVILLTYNQPYSNHNGGSLAFGPDGYLYIGAGDGGSGGDPQNNAQNITSLLGKILRIDVDNPQQQLNYGIPQDNPFADSTNANIKKEIFAWGLRNPWKFSFDSEAGSLWCGDVGQDAWEEVDIIQSGKDYGWRCYEGNHPYNLTDCNGIYESPIWEYSHSLGSAIIGGYVYRGKKVPELYGKYIYGDYSSARVWSLEYDGINPTVNTQITTASSSISSFGVDENNELYLVSLDGKIYGFTPTITNVTDKQSVNDFRLMQNFPNPFNPSTKIRYSVPNLTGSMSNQSLRVTLKVYDILGNEIVVLVDKEQPAGVYEVEFNSDIINKKSSSGVYFYKLTAGSFLESKKMILLK
jgi:glucose/arabinose dehydrogenase